jgi:hypothetical protein
MKKILKFFFPFFFSDWQGWNSEIYKGKVLWGMKMNDQLNKVHDKAFKAGQDLRKKVDKEHKWKIGDNKDNNKK